MEPIELAVENMNSYIAPFALTGELIIDYTDDDGKWQCLYRGTLNHGSGKSSCAAKVDTLIAHPEYNWGGQIPPELLAEGEKEYYGSLRLINCRDLESDWKGQLILAFSNRQQWQDVFYIAAILPVLRSAFKMDFELPPNINEDPFWGTAIPIAEDLRPVR